MISYSQNLEDILLNRAFQSKPNGFYIDVGAHDPVELSVTKLFYDLGWRGINIEPIECSHKKFVEQRPRDINLNCAIGTTHETKKIYTLENSTEYASMDRKVVEIASKMTGEKIEGFTIETRTLSEICEQYANGKIDFLKVDVEGWEKEVILSADWSKFRPTLLVIEATKPCEAYIKDWNNPDEAAAWQEWEPILVKADYEMVFYDGMNRFYLKKESNHLASHYSIPITPIQDSFKFYNHYKENNDLKNENDSLRKRYETIEDKYKTRKKSNEELKKEHETLKSEKKSLNKKNDNLKRDSQLLKEELKSLKSEHDSLRGRYEYVEDKCKIFEGKTDTLLKEGETFKSEKKSLSEKNDNLNRKSELLKEEHNALRSKHDSLRGRYEYVEDKCKEFEGKTDGLVKECEAFRSENKLLNEKNDNLNRKSELLKEEHNAFKSKHDLLRAKYEYVEDKCKVFEGKTNELRIINESLEAEIILLNDNNSTLEEKYGSFKNKLKALKRENEDLTIKDKSLCKELATQKDLVSALIEDNKFYKTNYRELGGLVNNIIEKIDKIIVRYNVLKLDYCEISGNNFNLNDLSELRKSLIDLKIRSFSHIENNLQAKPEQINKANVFDINCKESIDFPKNLPLWLHELFLLEQKEIINSELKKERECFEKKLDFQWSFECFVKSKEKNIVQAGWLFKNIHALYCMPESKKYKKISIINSSDLFQKVFNKEENELMRETLYFPFMNKSVEAIEEMNSIGSKKFLNESVLFAHYYDFIQSPLIHFAISTATPILVNALPSVIELLGEDYPLYYFSYIDANKKINNLNLIKKANEFLTKL